MLRFKNLSRLTFSEDKSHKKDFNFLTYQQLKKAIEQQHFFVRKYHRQLASQFVKQIYEHRWTLVKKKMRLVNMNQMDSWISLRKISNALTTNINKIDMRQMSKEQIQDLLFALNLFRYEPIRQQSNNEQNQKIYDNCESFLDQLQNYVNTLRLTRSMEHLIDIARKLMHTNSYLFVPNRVKIEKYIIDELDTLVKKGALLNQLIMKGCISHFWTDQFKQNIVAKLANTPYSKCLKSVNFQNLLIPNSIAAKIQQNRVQTQSQIRNILQGYGYPTKANVLINSYEVDFLINQKLIVEYNGHHHYVINSNKLIQTVKQQWKKQVLNQRGFIFSAIPYDQWKKLKLFEEKRNFIINKIQYDWMKYWGKGANQNRKNDKV